MRLFRRILVPHDLSPSATEALRVAADLARQARGRLVVLHVTPLGGFASIPPIAAEAATVVTPPPVVSLDRAELETVVRRALGRRPVRVECRVTAGDPAQEIVDAAGGVDSVVMTTAGRTGLGHLLLGSVAEQVVRLSPKPVLTLRAGAIPHARRRERTARSRPRTETRRRTARRG